jgi:hypothetical protein
MSRMRIVLTALVGCALLLSGASAQAAETVGIKAKFTPDKLGAPTNLFAEATFGSTIGPVPSPITKTVAMGPAGLELDLKGTGTCSAAILEGAQGPEGCPLNSIAGFGGGVGEFELAKEIIHENFTLEFFLGSNRPGHVVVLIYLNAVTPVSVQLVFTAPIVKEPKPYGLGFSVNVPLIATLPEASDASAESIHFSIGAKNVAYFRKVHGKKKLFHVKGILVPKRCPHGGFPIKSEISFEDGSTVTNKSTIPCPHK